jgi:hypothetical protein
MSLRLLIIVVSDRLREALGKHAPVVLGDVELQLHHVSGRSEKEWEHGLSDELQKTLPRVPILGIRIAAHLGTCFTQIGLDAFQLRLPAEEMELKGKTGINDLQVWGFRHDLDQAPIWSALVAVQRAVYKAHSGGAPLNDADRIHLGTQLDKAFVQAAAHSLYESFSVCRHRILGLFLSIRLNLELAAERRHNQPAKVYHYTDTIEKLDQKRMEAAEIFKTGMEDLRQYDVTIRHHVQQQESVVLAVLNDPPGLQEAGSASLEFNEWLARLDNSLEQLRNRLVLCPTPDKNS